MLLIDIQEENDNIIMLRKQLQQQQHQQNQNHQARNQKNDWKRIYNKISSLVQYLQKHWDLWNNVFYRISQ